MCKRPPVNLFPIYISLTSIIIHTKEKEKKVHVATLTVILNIQVLHLNVALERHIFP